MLTSCRTYASAVLTSCRTYVGAVLTSRRTEVSAALTSCRTYVSAVLPRSLGGQRLDLVPVELRRAAVVLGLGVAGGAAVLVEEGRLRRKQRLLKRHFRL